MAKIFFEFIKQFFLKSFDFLFFVYYILFIFFRGVREALRTSKFSKLGVNVPGIVVVCSGIVKGSVGLSVWGYSVV